MQINTKSYIKFDNKVSNLAEFLSIMRKGNAMSDN